MKEGREILLSAINEKLKSISLIQANSYIVENINLVDLINSINEDKEYLINVPDSLIDTIVLNSNLKNKSDILRDIHNIKNLMYGKKEYNIKFQLNEKMISIIDKFVNLIIELLNSNNKDILNMNTILDKCEETKYALKKDYLITELDFIKNIILDYDQINYGENLMKVYSYIFNHNFKIISIPELGKNDVSIKYEVTKELDDSVKEVLNNMGISIEVIPVFIKADLEDTVPEKIVNIYNLIRKNKAEDYGILHLFDKENILAKLALLVYSDEDTIKSIIDKTRDSKGKININLLKSLLNNTITIFINHDNDYFHSKYNNFMKNIELLKAYGINYPTLLVRNPLFVICDHDKLYNTLNKFKNVGFDIKILINRCYKVLSYNPELLLDNLELLINMGLDVNLLIKSSNYNILKVTNLAEKLSRVKQGVNVFDINDFITITRLITENVLKSANIGEV